MSPLQQLQQEVQKLQRQVGELTQWKKEKERQQLTFPLDVASLQTLNQGFKAISFDRINVTDIYFTSVEEGATVPGQMRFFNDRTTPSYRGFTTAAKTFTVA